MPEINYIKHLNSFFLELSQDKRLNATHVSMYVVLFYQWNNARFSDEFYINRNEIMSLSRIGSKGTYHKCLKDLHKWQYLEYLPSYNPQIGSSIKMFEIGTPIEQVVNRTYTKSDTGSVQVSGPYLNIYKHDKDINIKKTIKKDILFFFKEKEWPKIEAEKFFNHYEAVGWKKGINPIENWQAAAENWMLKAEKFTKKKNSDLPPVQKWDNLHTNNNKNYNEPL
ncbi:hypothetical protein [Lutibacter sp.]|uniref:hypothetical protein n=1 Tax=Lutibacter sp. TaxID=1925666 RepID=UPI0027375710|nr:hypothetical protein [Lutibacter sp.]MDP3314177.1 hypothetical protein [Lutibacter sp.]